MASTEKIIRDPVHDVIAFRLNRPTDGLMFRLINAAEFQRLRRIRQLGMASLAYPGADHARYSHSLGVMQTARRILDQLRTTTAIDEADEVTCLAAALLHDLGHGPFSHVFERVSETRHEDDTRRMISDPGSDVHRTLADFDRSLPQRVLALMEGRSARAFYCDILSSQLDADRFDYLLRDNLMTGSRYGGFDLNWLLHALTVDEASGRLAVTSKGVSAIESYLQARYHMYRNVYFHKVVRAAEGMLKLALQRARRLAVQDRLGWPTESHPLHKALVGRTLTTEDFTDLDDITVLHCFKTWMSGEDAPLASLCHGLLYRRVFKTIDVSALSAESVSRSMEVATRAIAGAGGEPDYHLFLDEPSETAYETFSAGEPVSCSGANEILVRSSDGALRSFGTVSPLTDALNRQLRFRRIHVAPQYRDVVQVALVDVRQASVDGASLTAVIDDRLSS